MHCHYVLGVLIISCIYCCWNIQILFWGPPGTDDVVMSATDIKLWRSWGVPALTCWKYPLCFNLLEFPACIFAWDSCHKRVVRSAARPCPQLLLWWPLCCHIGLFSAVLPLSTALVGSGGAEQSLARLTALSAAGLKGREGMEQDSCYLHGVSIPLNLWRPQTHFLLLTFNTQVYSLKHAFLFRPVVKSNIPRVTIPKYIMLHFRVFQMLFSTRIQKGKQIK